MKWIGRFLQDPGDVISSHIHLLIKHAKKAILLSVAWLWSRIYRVRYRIIALHARHGAIVRLLFLLLLIGASVYWAPMTQNKLEPYFATSERLAGLQSLLLTLGGGLIGATVIAFSFVMFAMQVNIERMPYGLFRKFSSDRRLLGSFICTFFMAIAVAALSLISGKEWPWLAIAIMGASWGTVLILALFLYAYQRALFLINPLQQLVILLDNARREMRRWARRARVAVFISKFLEETASNQDSSLETTHDLPRLTLFRSNPHWTNRAQQAILHAASFVRRFAEQGDHEVSATALNVVVGINEAYVEAKGKTFFSTHPFFDNPLANDTFINETLEHLRQNIRVGLSRGDEQLIEQTFKALEQLVLVYLKIEYVQEHTPKTHAQLAASYLSNAVQSVLPHNMPDVLMEGLQLMGNTAQNFLTNADVNDITTITEKIELIACAGIVKEDHRPVTLTGVEQIAKLTFDLMRTKSYDIHFAAGELKKNVTNVAMIFLNVPETPLSNIHSFCLSPYYSCTSEQTLQAWLTNLGNELVKAKEDDEPAQAIIRNIEEWADGLYQTEMKLLLLAIEKKSSFTFDIIHWIAYITKVLLAISNAPACGDHTRNELRKHALWLVSALSWIPDDEETVDFVKSFQLTEILFEVATDAYQRNCIDVSSKIRDLLLSWAFKAGKYQSGWGMLERAMYGLATLVVARNDDKECDILKAAISDRLKKEDIPNQEIRDRTASDIRQRVANLYQKGHWSSRIENAMNQVNQEKLISLLEDIAILLSPKIVGDN
jgi:hypothetical protein